MKFTDHNMYVLGLLSNYAGEEFKILSGADELMCQAAVSGARGAIGSFYNVFGPTCQKVRQAFVGGDIARGRRFMLAFQKMIDTVLTSRSMWSFQRAAMQLKYDIDIGMPRAPLGIAEQAWSPGEVERLVNELEAAAE